MSTLDTRGHETAQAFSSGVRSRGSNSHSTIHLLETSGEWFQVPLRKASVSATAKMHDFKVVVSIKINAWYITGIHMKDFSFFSFLDHLWTTVALGSSYQLPLHENTMWPWIPAGKGVCLHTNACSYAWICKRDCEVIRLISVIWSPSGDTLIFLSWIQQKKQPDLNTLFNGSTRINTLRSRSLT